MQNWVKLGRIFVPDGRTAWMRTHAAVPFAERVDGDFYRVYFSARDDANRSLVGWVIIDINEPHRICEISAAPVLEPSCPGFFDEDGTMGCQTLEFGGKKFLYYIGWNRAMSVPFRNAIGLAVSEDNGCRFHRLSNGPILDRSIHDECFVASLCVLPDQGRLRMWYLSCFDWPQVGGRPQHRYHIKYAESEDGIDWRRDGLVAIDFRYPNEYAISVPRVLRDESGYRMWYSFRGGPVSETYRIGFAYSTDGLKWERRDEEVGLDVSEEGWDSDMLCYPFLFNHEGRLLMLYNGNAYGRTGFGLAVLDVPD